MKRILELPEDKNISVVIRPALSNPEFEELCAANPGLDLERTRDGAILVNTLASCAASDANSEINAQLRVWWWTHSRGKVFGSSTGVWLPDGSSMSPDAAYATEEQLSALTAVDLFQFLKFAPAFVVELSPSAKRLAETREKMERWIGNGALLGWLIDPQSKSVTIYEHGQPAHTETGPSLRGTGPVDGFVLSLDRVWAANRMKH